MTGWTIPDDAEVHAVLGYLVDENLKRLFFSELQNPEWVQPLADLGVFASEPALWVDADGTQRARTWPEGEYLARVATAKPDLVVQLLVDHSNSANPWVHRAVMDAALAVPAGHAVHLVPQILTAAELSYSRLDPRDIVSLAEAVASQSPRHMRRLLALVFEPLAGPVDASVLGSRQRVSPRFDSYWMIELTPRTVELLAGLGLGGVRLSAGWLIRALEIASPTGRADDTYIWRPSIAPHSQNLSDEGTDALIDIVRLTALRVGLSSPFDEVVAFLRGRGLMLLSRIAVDLLAEVVTRDGSSPAVDLGLELLTDATLLDLDARPEYVHLARVLLPALSDEQTATWQRFIVEEGWQGSDEDIRRLAEWRLPEGGRVVRADELRVRRSLRYRLLLPLQGVLPSEMENEVETLRAEFGSMDHPEFGSYMSSHFGPESAIEVADLDGLTPERLFSVLSDAGLSDDDRYGSSTEGVARVVAAFTESQPEPLAALGPRLLSLPRSFVRSAIEGWEAALATGFLPSDDLWQVLVQTANQPDNGDEPAVHLRADDPEWRWAQRRAVSFVAAYLRTREGALTLEDARTAWQVLRPLTSHVDPTLEHEERYGGSNMDPLTLSLNTVRPAALRTTIELLRAVHGREGAAALISELWLALSEHATASADPSLAVAAVLGEKLGHLWDLDHAWVDDRRPAIVDVLGESEVDRQRSDVVVSVALRMYRTTAGFLELMRPTLADMLTADYREREHVEGWRGNRTALAAAANHVLTGYVTSLLDEDDALLSALTSPAVGAGVIGEALGVMGWTFARARDDEEALATVPEEVLQRARSMIDRRVAAIRDGVADPAELSEFYWWVRAGLFPPSWWLDVLTVAVTNPDFNPRGLIGDALAGAAPSEPEKAVRVLDALILNDREGWARHDLLEHAPAIVIAAMNSPDEPTRDVARELLDRLGREGYFSTLAEVDRLRSSGGA